MKKIYNMITNVIAVIAVLIVIACVYCNMTGISACVMESESMGNAVSKGSLVLYNKSADINSINENDIIVFDAGTGKTVHAVSEVSEEGLITQGTANDRSDGLYVTNDEYLGKEVFAIPVIGTIVHATTSSVGKIVILAILVVWMILGLVLNRRQDDDLADHDERGGVDPSSPLSRAM